MLISTTLAAVPTTALAKVSAPDAFKRTGAWVVDYSPDSCRLMAAFGAGKDVIMMRLTRYQLGDAFDLDLFGRRLANNEIRSKVRIDFGLGGTPVEATAVNGKAGDLPIVMLGSMRLDGWEEAKPDETGPKLSAQQEAAVSAVTVKIGSRKPFRLEFGSIGKPMQQLGACQDSLLKSWGYDPAVQATLSKPARPANSPAMWLRSSDYPPGAVFNGQNGIVQFRLDVDEEGRIAGCHVLARTNPDVFADTTCRSVSRRARFEPALDAAGKPARTLYVAKVRWQMGE